MNTNIRAAKESTVSQIVEAIKGAKSVSIVEYRGLRVSELETLRRELAKNNSELKIYKNTLVTIAGKELGYDGLAEHLTGPNAIVFSNEDEVSAPSALYKFAKKHDKLVVKAGLIEGNLLVGKEFEAIAKLPGKNGLLSMFLSCLNAPLTKFAATVKAVADAKGE